MPSCHLSNTPSGTSSTSSSLSHGPGLPRTPSSSLVTFSLVQLCPPEPLNPPPGAELSISSSFLGEGSVACFLMQWDGWLGLLVIAGSGSQGRRAFKCPLAHTFPWEAKAAHLATAHSHPSFASLSSQPRQFP